MYAALTGVSFLLLFGVVLWATTRFMDRQIDDTVSSEIAEILADPDSATPAGPRATLGQLTRHSRDFYYLLQDPAGNVLAGNLPATDPVVGIREWGGEAT